jgi:hypothetical protein
VVRLQGWRRGRKKPKNEIGAGGLRGGNGRDGLSGWRGRWGRDLWRREPKREQSEKL